MNMNYSQEMQPAIVGDLYDLSVKTTDSYVAEEGVNCGVPVKMGTKEGIVKEIATGEASDALGVVMFEHKQLLDASATYYQKGYVMPVVSRGRVWVKVDGEITPNTAAKYDPATKVWKADGSEEIPNAKFITSANAGMAVVQIG